MIQVPRFEVCTFCQDLSGDRECVFVARTELAAVEINERAYERGAMLVIPNVHRETILDLNDAEIAAVYQLARTVAKAAIHALGATGVNIFQNSGMTAGQTEAHFHVHVVPRYPGSDPNRQFRHADFDTLPLEEQRQVAKHNRNAL